MGLQGVRVLPQIRHGALQKISEDATSYIKDQNKPSTLDSKVKITP